MYYTPNLMYVNQVSQKSKKKMSSFFIHMVTIFACIIAPLSFIFDRYISKLSSDLQKVVLSKNCAPKQQSRDQQIEIRH